MIISIGISSCKKEVNPILSNSQTEESSGKGDDEPMLKSTFIESEVSPKIGKPNVTDFVFQVYDPSGTQAISVKFFEHATGAVNYVAMSRVGSYWRLTKKMINNGWFDYRYVYTVTNQATSPTIESYRMCATHNTFNASGTSSIKWPFGADGSSFTNRLQWIGSHEGGCGSNWGENGHYHMNCGASDYYAEDWNKNCSSAYSDDGSEVRSPLDGKVIGVNGIGYGYSVDIEQKNPSNGDVYVFRIGHLKYTPPVSIGTWVKAGYTKIGNVGMTGTATAPHAHIVLYKQNLNCKQGIQFLLNAN